MCYAGMDAALGKAAQLDKYQRTGNPADFPDNQGAASRLGPGATSIREGPSAIPVAPAPPIGPSIPVNRGAADASTAPTVKSLLGQ
jgi:hypothetical protein